MKDEYYSKDVFFCNASALIFTYLMELRIQECSYFGEIKKKEILKIALVSRFIYVQGKKEKTLKSKTKILQASILAQG